MKIIEKARRFVARLSLWRGVALALRCLFLLLVVVGFFYLVDISGGVVVAGCGFLSEVWQFICSAFVWPSKLTGAQALAGLIMLLPLGVLVVVQLWHWLVHRHEEKIDGTFQYLEQQSQDAIDNVEDDDLERDLFVRHFASLLVGDIGGRHALYIGLHGEWGEGKTSVLNLVRRKLEPNSKLVFVEFCSWEHEDKKDLPYVLFSQIARTVADRLDLGLALLLFRYAILLVPRKLIGIAGPFEWVLDLVVRLMNAMSSVDRLRKRIERRLESLEAKIIVIVDDMDRLEPEDLRNVLRVLRTSGDLSHFVFCLPASREFLIKGIAKSGEKEMTAPDAEEYVQKIIQLEIDLPLIHPGVLQNIFCTRLEEVLKGYRLPPLSNCDKLTLYFRNYIHNYREMMRLLNKLIARIGFYNAVGGDEFPVCLEDLIALTIINIHDADFWKNLFVYRDVLQNDALNRLIDDRELDVEMVKRVFGLDDKARGFVRVSFLRDYMGVEVVINNDDVRSVKASVDRREAEEERRLKASKCFLSYYNGTVPHLPEVGFKNGVLKRLDNEDALVEFFKQQNERGILGASLDYLENMQLIEGKEQRATYLRALMRLADMRFKWEEPFGRDPLGIEKLFDVGNRLSRCVNFMLRKLPESSEISRGSEFLAAARATGAIVILAHAVRWDDRKSGAARDMEYFFNEDEYEELKELFLLRVKELQKKGKLIGHVDEENIRRIWRVLFMMGRLQNVDKELSEYKELLMPDITAYPNVLHVLLPYRYYCDRAVEDYSQMWFGQLDKELDIRVILQTLTTALELNGAQWLQKLVDNINQAIIYHKEHSKWPHPDNQQLFRGE